MDQNLKERLVGASVLVILAVIFIPMFLSDEPITDDRITETNIPEKPESFSSRIVPLEPDTETDTDTDASRATETGLADSVEEIETITDMAATQEDEATAPDSDDTEPEPTVRQAENDSNGVGLTAWVVQLGSFSSEANAQSLNRQLRELKYPAFVEPLVRGEKVIYRVRVGPELRRSNAEKLQQQIKQKLDIDGILVKYP